MPNTGDSAAYDRYAYVKNNPFKYTDPSGHRISCGDGEVGACGNANAQSIYFDKEKWYRQNSFYGWWTGRNEYYNGSGGFLGHGIRQLIAKEMSKNNFASNFWELLGSGLLQKNRVTIKGQALEKIKNDDAVMQTRSNVINLIKKHPDYGGAEFTKSYMHKVTLGGSTNEKLRSATNELTWMIRATNIRSDVYVHDNNSMQITYTLVNDKLDLRPDWKNRSIAYNLTTSVLGFVYHDLLGGNDEMIVTAQWSEYIQ